MLLACNGNRLCYLGFAVNGNRHLPLKKMKACFPHACFVAGDVSGMAKKVSAAWSDKGNVPVELHGTPFQAAVWKALLEIPRGRTVCYSDIAAKIGRPKAVRAVGGAVGANPVSLLVPCHRVLPASGGVGNYLWGAGLKEKILRLESGAYRAANALINNENNDLYCDAL